MKLFANQERRGTLRDYLPVAAVFLISLLLGSQILRVHVAHQASEQREEANNYAATHAQLLQDNFSRSLAATQGITTILKQFGHLDDFTDLSKEIIGTYNTITSISLAPDAVISRIYPDMGHEAALGMNLLGERAPDRQAVATAIASRRTIYSGPIEMANGMNGIVARIPVYLESAGTEQFWGIISQVSNLERIGIAAGLQTIIENGYDYKLINGDYPAGELLSNSDTPLTDPVLFPLQLPAGAWTLAIAPTDDWGHNEMYAYELAIILLVSALFTLIAAVRAQEGIMLGIEVRQRTAALHDANLSIGKENDERHTIELGLQASEEQWRRLLEHIPYMLLIHDRSGRILNVNQRTCDTLGFSREQLLARTISDINISLRTRADEQLALLEPGQPLMTRGEYRRINAQTVPVEVRNGIIHTADGPQVIALARDVSEAIAAEQAITRVNIELEERVNARTAELRESLEELRMESNERLNTEKQMSLASELSQQANQTRSRFFENITDGIHAPIAALMTPLRELAECRLDRNAQQLAMHAHQSAQRLDHLIGELLDYNHLESSTLTIQPSEIHLFDLVRETVSLHAAMAHSKKLTFECNMDPQTPATIQLDPMRFRQILDNLIGNAIKFTSQGHVALHIAPLAGDEGIHALRIHITDTGIGIPQAARAHIFEPFTQADNSVARSFGGTGLGLTISHQLAIAMGGSLEIVEREEPGLCMRLEIAIEPVSTLERLPQNLREAIAGQSIELLCDNPCACAFLTSQLTDWGMQVITRTGERQPDSGHLLLADSGSIDAPEIRAWSGSAGLGLMMDETEEPPAVPEQVQILHHPVRSANLQDFLERAFGLRAGSTA